MRFVAQQGAWKLRTSELDGARTDESLKANQEKWMHNQGPLACKGPCGTKELLTYSIDTLVRYSITVTRSS